jgi:hypothetical protein
MAGRHCAHLALICREKFFAIGRVVPLARTMALKKLCAWRHDWQPQVEIPLLLPSVLRHSPRRSARCADSETLSPPVWVPDAEGCQFEHVRTAILVQSAGAAANRRTTGSVMGGWLLFLCFFLFAWEPLRFAGDLTGVAGTVAMRGGLGVLELGVHAAVAALAVAAAWALWIRNPRAPVLAAVAVAASAVVTVQSIWWSRLASNVVPGEGIPMSLLAIAHAAGWITYLRKSRRVRAVYD